MTTREHGAPSYPFSAPHRLDVHPRFAELRRDKPLTRVTMPYGGQAWLVTRHADVKLVLADPRFSRAATVGKDAPRTLPMIPEATAILNMDPPDHTRLRKLVAKAFTARRVAELRERAQRIVDDLVDTMLSAGPPADLASALAWPLPITVICEMLGVPTADRDQFQAWAGQLLALSETAPGTIAEAGDKISDYLVGLIGQRRVQPSDDLLGVLVAARDQSERLSEEELVDFGVSLLVAGHETTANQIGNFAYTLLAQRQRWNTLVADPSLLSSAIEELLRFIPLGAVAGFPRIAIEDVELGGQTIRAGEAVVAEIGSANRDATVFDHPDELDLSRKDIPHLAFGHGAHHCLGAQLARMELQAAIGTLVRRVPTLRLAVPADEVAWRSNRLIRGVLALPVEW